MAKRLGTILLEMEYVTKSQLEEALRKQADGKEWIGQSMVSQGMLSLEDVSSIIAFQQSDKGKGKLFGVCAVGMGMITEEQRLNIMKYQDFCRGILGDVLADLGHLTDLQRNEAVRLQFLQL